MSLELSSWRVAWKLTVAWCALFVALTAAQAQTSTSLRVDERAPLEVNGVNEGDAFSFGRSMIINGTVQHGVVAMGGDVEIFGTVEGDVATIGGSVIQHEGSRIGGDVMVLGGAYHHGKTAPNRDPNSTTLMFAGFEPELRKMVREPTSVLVPQLTRVYLGQRVLTVLFWFITSLALTAVTPGAVSRAVARLQLTNLRVGIIGLLGSIVLVLGSSISLLALPTVLGALVGIMALLFVIVAYLFGRVVIHAATGRWLQRLLLPEGKRSESVALLAGTCFWTIILSLPFVWPLAAGGLMALSLGLTLTARYRNGWKRAESV